MFSVAKHIESFGLYNEIQFDVYISRINIPYIQDPKKMQEQILCQKSIVYDQKNYILNVFCIWVMGKGIYDVIRNKASIIM